MSDEWEQKKRELIATFVNIIRTSKLKDNVNTQNLSFFINQLMDSQQEAEFVDFVSLYDHLLEENRALATEIKEAMVFLQSRQERIGITFHMPPAISGVPPAERKKIIDKWTLRMTPTSDYSSLTRKEAPADIGEKPTRTDFAKKKARGGPSPAYFITIGLLLAAGAGMHLYKSSNPLPAARPVTIPIDTGGLPCTKLTGVMPVLICTMPQNIYRSYRSSVATAKMNLTLDAAQGYRKIRVLDSRTGKILGFR